MFITAMLETMFDFEKQNIFYRWMYKNLAEKHCGESSDEGIQTRN